MTPDTIVIHCSATREGENVTAAHIDQWHRQRGFRKIGYHYVVRLDGTVERGRQTWEIGAHCSEADESGLSYNRHSIGICYIGGLDAGGKGKDTRTEEQKRALGSLIERLCKVYSIKRIIGHRDASPDRNGNGVVEPHEWLKVCPCFDAAKEYGGYVR